MTIYEQATKLKHLAYLFIAKKQNKNGGFTSHTNTKHGLQEHNTIFYPALIGTVLAEITLFEQNTAHEDILKHLKNFWLLQSPLSHPSWYTYWSTQDPNYQHLQYPPDLDDSSLALISKQYLYPDTDFSKINTDFIVTLTGHEQKPGGPYRTWLGCESVSPWNDYDPVVNSNIHYLLSTWNVHLHNLNEYLVNALKNNAWRSPYYTSDYLSLYLITRSLDTTSYSEINTTIIEFMSAQPPQSQLDYACAIIISSRLKLKLHTGLEKRLLTMTANAFAADPCVREQGNDVSGCDALTAALVALAANQLELNTANIPEESTDSAVERERRIHDSAVSTVAKKLHSLDQTLFESSLPQLCALIQTPLAKEITLLSHDIGSSLQAPISEQLYALLGSANLFGWLAFQWYDECYDEKIISPRLSLANICLRESTNAYLQAANQLQVNPAILFETLDQVDKAHAYEIANNLDIQQNLQTGKKLTHLPCVMLSERSYGHCLGPLLIIQSLQIKNVHYQQLRRLFTHYLNTRQLCDDLHDWYEDFTAKRLTSVTRYLFMTSNLFPRAAQNQTQKIFWHEGLAQALTNTKYELQQATNSLHAIKWTDHEPIRLAKTLQRFKQAITDAEKERKTSQALLTHYETTYEPI